MFDAKNASVEVLKVELDKLFNATKWEEIIDILENQLDILNNPKYVDDYDLSYRLGYAYSKDLTYDVTLSRKKDDNLIKERVKRIEYVREKCIKCYNNALVKSNDEYSRDKCLDGIGYIYYIAGISINAYKKHFKLNNAEGFDLDEDGAFNNALSYFSKLINNEKCYVRTKVKAYYRICYIYYKYMDLIGRQKFYIYAEEFFKYYKTLKDTKFYLESSMVSYCKDICELYAKKIVDDRYGNTFWQYVLYRDYGYEKEYYFADKNCAQFIAKSYKMLCNSLEDDLEFIFDDSKRYNISDNFVSECLKIRDDKKYDIKKIERYSETVYTFGKIFMLMYLYYIHIEREQKIDYYKVSMDCFIYANKLVYQVRKKAMYISERIARLYILKEEYDKAIEVIKNGRDYELTTLVYCGIRINDKNLVVNTLNNMSRFHFNFFNNNLILIVDNYIKEKKLFTKNNRIINHIADEIKQGTRIKN